MCFREEQVMNCCIVGYLTYNQVLSVKLKMDLDGHRVSSKQKASHWSNFIIKIASHVKLIFKRHSTRQYALA